MVHNVDENIGRSKQIVLHRIKAVQWFDDIKKDQLGGYVESDSNLSQSGNCWIDKDSVVCGNSRIINDARIIKSKIYDSSINHQSSVFNSIVYKSIIEDDAKIKNSIVTETRASMNAIIENSVVKIDSWITGAAKVQHGCSITKSKIFNGSKLANIEISNGSISTTGFTLGSNDTTKIVLPDACITSSKDILYIPFFNHSHLSSVMFYKDNKGDIKVWCLGLYTNSYETFKRIFRNSYTSIENKTVEALIELVNKYFNLKGEM